MFKVGKFQSRPNAKSVKYARARHSDSNQPENIVIVYPFRINQCNKCKMLQQMTS